MAAASSRSGSGGSAIQQRDHQSPGGVNLHHTRDGLVARIQESALPRSPVLDGSNLKASLAPSEDQKGRISPSDETSGEARAAAELGQLLSQGLRCRESLI